MQLNLEAGDHLPLHASASGKLYLSFLKEQDATDIFSLVIEKDFGWAEFTSISSYTDRELSEIQEGPASTLAVFDFYYNGSNAPGTANHPFCAAGAAFGLCPGFPGLFNLTLGAGTTVGDGYNLLAANSYNNYISERKTQEFRLVSTDDSRLKWTVGAFWKDSEEDIKSQQKAYYNPPTPTSGGGNLGGELGAVKDCFI